MGVLYCPDDAMVAKDSLRFLLTARAEPLRLLRQLAQKNGAQTGARLRCLHAARYGILGIVFCHHSIIRAMEHETEKGIRLASLTMCLHLLGKTACGSYWLHAPSHSGCCANSPKRTGLRQALAFVACMQLATESSE